MIRPAQGAGDDVIDVEWDPDRAAQHTPWEPLTNLTGQLGPRVAVADPLPVIG